MKSGCRVEWPDVPLYLRMPFALGAIINIMVAHIIGWAFYSCFGSFDFGEEEGREEQLSGLVWIGQDGLIKAPGLACLGLCLASILFCFSSYVLWVRYMNRSKFSSIKAELDEHEAEWKADRLKEVQAASLVSSQPLGDGESVVSSRRSSLNSKSSVGNNTEEQLSSVLFNAVRSRSNLVEGMRDAAVAEEAQVAQEQADAKQAAWFCNLASMSKSFSDLNSLLDLQATQDAVAAGHGQRRPSSAKGRSTSTLASVSEHATETPCDETEEMVDDVAQSSPLSADAPGSLSSPQLPPVVEKYFVRTSSSDQVGEEQPANAPGIFSVKGSICRTLSLHSADLRDDPYGSASRQYVSIESSLANCSSDNDDDAQPGLYRVSTVRLDDPELPADGRNGSRNCYPCNTNPCSTVKRLTR